MYFNENRIGAARLVNRPLAQLVKHLRFEQIFENLISVDCVGAMSPIFNHLLELRLWAWRIS